MADTHMQLVSDDWWMTEGLKSPSCVCVCLSAGLQIIQQAWPFIGQYLEKLLVETIAPSIRASTACLQTLSFTKVDLGDKVES